MARQNKKKLNRAEIEDAMLGDMSEYVANVQEQQRKNGLDGIKVEIKCKTKNQKVLVDELRKREIVVCSGLPGTGKTYLSCAVALELLKKDSRFKKIYIIKSVTTLKDEEIGFLKGNVKEKMEPFMFSFMHNFEKIIGTDALIWLRANGLIQELPIAYMRGINIDNAIAIIDEAQNISVDNIRTIMTRLGTDSKMIFLGDTKQIDMKKKEESSLQFVIDNFSDVEAVGTVVLTEDDVVRNPLIKVIEERFLKAYAAKEEKPKTTKKTKTLPEVKNPAGEKGNNLDENVEKL
jgi:phosphate starvation-inducible PhoH-like protein